METFVVDVREKAGKAESRLSMASRPNRTVKEEMGMESKREASYQEGSPGLQGQETSKAKMAGYYQWIKLGGKEVETQTLGGRGLG